MLRSIMLSAQLFASDPASASFASLDVDFQASKARAEYAGYVEGLGRSKAFPSLGTLGACARLAAGAITVLVAIDADGRVTDVAADSDSAAGDCYAKAFAGAQFAPPTSAPFVLAVVFGPRAR